MKSIKPGRGPSMMNAVSSIAAGVFGVFWTIGAARMGAPGFFVGFGVVFILLSVGQAIYAFYNATSKNRMSTFDITEHGEEPDPLDPGAHTGERPAAHTGTGAPERFCPWCGAPTADGYAYCRGCGRKLPD